MINALNQRSIRVFAMFSIYLTYKLISSLIDNGYSFSGIINDNKIEIKKELLSN